MMLELSNSERNQLWESTTKLFHYLFAFTKVDCKVTIPELDYVVTYRAPQSISISYTLWSRIDNCHGAGNCCLIPYDLVYTGYDRSRIVNYDRTDWVDQFGEQAAEVWDRNRDVLLDSLQPFYISVETSDGVREYPMFVKINNKVRDISGCTSCTFLFAGKDRYYCGAHPFKPLHCWFPHMTVRRVEREGDARNSVSIGRMQYGRNHKFGCPVVFINTKSESIDDTALFTVPDPNAANYFNGQFNDDIAKLEWCSRSAQAVGQDVSVSYAPMLPSALRTRKTAIRAMLISGHYQSMELWTNPNPTVV